VWAGIKGVWSLIKGWWSLIKGWWSLIKGVWSLIKGWWSLIKGVWSLIKGWWSLIKGVWSLIKGVPAKIKGVQKDPKSRPKNYLLMRFFFATFKILHFSRRIFCMFRKVLIPKINSQKIKKSIFTFTKSSFLKKPDHLRGFGYDH
jgi:hypothetical protein